MKKLILVFFSVFLSTVLFSQSVDLDRYYVDYTERHLPKKPLPADMRTYRVEAKFGDEISEIIDPYTFENSTIGIHGLNRTTGAAGVTAKYKFTPISIVEIKIDEVKHESKNKEGVVTTTYTYEPKIIYKVGSSYEIVDYTNKVVEWSTLKDFNSSFTSTYEAGSYSSYKDAANYLKLNRDVVVIKLTKEYIAQAAKAINTYLNENYGYPTLTTSLNFWYLGSKKHPEYLSHVGNFNAVKAIIEKINENGGIEEARKEIAPYITYLEEMVTKYNQDNKKDRKMRYASFYNMGLIYLLLDMPDEAIKQGELLIANDYDKGDGKYLVNTANKLKERFVVNETNTRHFPITWLTAK